MRATEACFIHKASISLLLPNYALLAILFIIIYGVIALLVVFFICGGGGFTLIWPLLTVWNKIVKGTVLTKFNLK